MLAGGSLTKATTGSSVIYSSSDGQLTKATKDSLIHDEGEPVASNIDAEPNTHRAYTNTINRHDMTPMKVNMPNQ